MQPSWKLLSALGAVLEASGALLGAVPDVFGTIEKAPEPVGMEKSTSSNRQGFRRGGDGFSPQGALGGASEGVFWTSWNLLGASWGRVDAHGPLGTILNRLGGPQSRLAAIRGRCGPVLGGS